MHKTQTKSCSRFPLKVKPRWTTGQERLKAQVGKLFPVLKNLEKAIMVLFLSTPMVIGLISFICKVVNYAAHNNSLFRYFPFFFTYSIPVFKHL